MLRWVGSLLVGLVAGAALLPYTVAQEPSSPATPPAGRGAAEWEEVRAEVSAFYAEYWKAWEDHNLTAVANALASDFVVVQHLAGPGVVQLDKHAAITGVNQFFQGLGKRESSWSRTLLAVLPRTATDAVVAVRTDFALQEGGGETELSLEVVRKFPDGRWRLVRKWSEKSPF